MRGRAKNVKRGYKAARRAYKSLPIGLRREGKAYARKLIGKKRMSNINNALAVGKATKGLIDSMKR